jgi:hypothetical protein
MGESMLFMYLQNGYAHAHVSAQVLTVWAMPLTIWHSLQSTCTSASSQVEQSQPAVRFGLQDWQGHVRKRCCLPGRLSEGPPLGLGPAALS